MKALLRNITKVLIFAWAWFWYGTAVQRLAQQHLSWKTARWFIIALAIVLDGVGIGRVVWPFKRTPSTLEHRVYVAANIVIILVFCLALASGIVRPTYPYWF